MSTLLLPSAAMASQAVEFNRNFLYGKSAQQVDLDRFEKGDMLPGIYSADVRINGATVGRRDVEVRAMDDGSTAVCLTPQLVDLFGLNATRVEARRVVSEQTGEVTRLRPLPKETFCDALSNYIPDATVSFDAGEQVLDVSIPQAYLARDPRGWVSPELWDDGITAARVGYSANHLRLNSSGGGSNYTTSVVLNAGANVGAWRFRHDGYLSDTSGAGTHYSAGRTYVQRAVPKLEAQLTLGDFTTNGDIFDSVNYRGANISSDERMLPDSESSYAPVVRGIAQTNARVTIRQLGTVVYETMVSPGPFEIADLYGTSYGGDLQVEVTEADGRVQRFTVPFAAVPQLLREGQQRYSVTAGKLRNATAGSEPGFVEATLRRGISNQVTLFGGVTASQGYGAALFGGAVNTRLGAFSGDVTASRTNLPGQMPGFGSTMSGQSYRVTYSKNMVTTGTYFSVAAYRYSTQGYLSLSDAARLRDNLSAGLDGQNVQRQRSRVDLTVNQRLGEGNGSLYISGSSANYWSNSQRTTSYSAGYSNSWRRINYNINVQRTMEQSLFNGGATRTNNTISLNVSIPLGKAGSNAPSMSTSFNRSSNGGSSINSNLSGSFGENRQGSYNASVGHSTGNNNVGGGLNYNLPVADLNASFSQASGSRQLSVGASGGVVLHKGGVAFSQQLGDTIGIVEVPNAEGAQIGNAVGVKTNAQGFAVVPYLSPYRRNDVTVDPKGLPLEIDLKVASVMTVPTAGAIVKVTVPTVSGRSALIEAPQDNGQPLPFGVEVTNEAGDVVGVVGQGSRLWVRGVEEKGRLSVNWGQGAAQQCAIDYSLAGVASGELVVTKCRVDVLTKNRNMTPLAARTAR